MRTRLRLAKNAVANLTRGGAAGIVAIFLPAALARHMTQLNYSVWVLVLQVAAYCSYLEFGLQTAVGRYIAISEAKQDLAQRDSVYSTALAGLALASLIAILLLIGTALSASLLFPRVPRELLPEMRWALIIVGGSIALGLPSSAWSGVFVGLQRNEFIAAVTGGSKLLSAAALAFVVVRGASLRTMAITVATVNLLSTVALYLLVRRVSNISFRPRLIRRAVMKELFSYCSSLMVWSFSMMLVSGLDLILVGRFDLGALAPYAIATTLVTFIAGAQSAVFSAMMPHAAVLHANQDSGALGRIVVWSTRLSVLLLGLTGLPLLIYGRPLLVLWVGRQYAVQGAMLLSILLVANMVRLSGIPYATVLVAAAQQKLVTVSPLIEGFSNLLASLLLGAIFGAPGVAAGTLIGAVAGMLGHVFYNIPRTRNAIQIRSLDFVFSGIAFPALVTIPLIALACYSRTRSIPSTGLFTTALALTCIPAALLFARTRSRETKSAD